MRYSKILLKTNKEAREFDSINATLLQKGSFIDQTMAGVYTFLPLGLRVLTKIENIIREEMDKVGTEMLMPSLSPKKLWETTGRAEIDVLFEARGANEASLARNDGVYMLNPTHEDVLAPIAMKMRSSYKEFPFAVYQIQTKFRNEERPKSGLLRGREFRMKDLYSFHLSDEDRKKYYEEVKEVYKTIFNRLGIGDDTVVAKAGGGDFTDEFTDEFDTKCEAGEDVVYYDEPNDVYYNEEVVPDEVKQVGEKFAVAEVGNLLPLGTKFAEAFGHKVMDSTGTMQVVHMASYGIGSSRIMGVLVEKFNDERGIIWPASVAPYQVHLVGLKLDDEAMSQRAEDIYSQLVAANVEVLYDDRVDTSPGEKLAEADLIGCPWRVVVSPKTGEQVEVKGRTEPEAKLISPEDLRREIS